MIFFEMCLLHLLQIEDNCYECNDNWYLILYTIINSYLKKMVLIIVTKKEKKIRIKVSTECLKSWRRMCLLKKKWIDIEKLM